MPVIPRLQLDSQLGQAPGPVLDNQRRPTVDMRGAISRMEGLGKDAAQPLLPDGLDAPYRALGALGNAIADAGGAIGAMAVKRQEAIDRNERDKADLAFLERQAAFQDWQGSVEGQMNPHLWGERWKQTVEGFQPFDDKSPISSGARTAFSADIQRANLQYGMRLNEQANSQIFSTAKQSAVTKARTAYENGNQENGDAFLDEAVGSGFMYDWQADAERQQGHKAAEAKQNDDAFNGHLALATGTPDEWLKGGMASEGMDPVVKARLDDAARSAKRNGIADASMEVRELIASDTITVPEQIDNLEDPRLSPLLKEELKDVVRKSNDADHQQWVEDNRQFNFVRLRKDVDAYNPATDPDGVKFQALSLVITRDLPTDLRAEVGGDLDAKFRGLKTAAPTGMKAMVGKISDTLFNEGKFGQWKKQADPAALGMMQDLRWTKQVGISSDARKEIEAATDPARKAELFRQAWATADVTPADRKKAMADFSLDDQRKIEALVSGQDDEAARIKAIAAQAQVERQMDEWLKVNPAATEQQTLEKMQEFVPAGVRAGVLMDMQRARSGQSPARRATPESVRNFIEPADLKEKLPTALRGHAQDFIDAGRETGLDPRFLAAVSMLETADGTSSAFRNKKNAMGISDSKGPTAQTSVRESIFRQARTLAREDGPYAGADTIDAIGAIYAPPGAGNDPKGTNGYWPKGVAAKYAKL